MYNRKKFLGLLMSQAREERGITQIELADELDCDLRTIQKIENGDGNPLFTALVSYAKALHISLDVLTQGEPSEKGLLMDRLYRQLISLDTESANLIIHAAQCYCAWRDNQEISDLE